MCMYTHTVRGEDVALWQHTAEQEVMFMSPPPLHIESLTSLCKEFDRVTGDIFSAEAEEMDEIENEDTSDSDSDVESDSGEEEFVRDEGMDEGEQEEVSTTNSTSVPEWVNAELETELAAQVGASIEADGVLEDSTEVSADPKVISP